MERIALLFAALLVAAGPAWGTVDVNTATKEQLEAEGMGPVAAQAIVDHREKHGPFTSGDEVRKVIDDAIASRLSIGISISGPPPAKAATATAPAPSQDKAAAAKPAEAKPAETRPAETKPAPKDDQERDNVRNKAKKDQDDRKT